MKALIDKVQAGIDLNSGDIAFAITLLLSDQVEDEAKAAFLTALHQKGESAEEIAGFVELLMERAIVPLIDPAEMPGPMKDSKLTPRIGQTAKLLWAVYAGLTAACIVFLRFAGTSAFASPSAHLMPPTRMS